MKSELKAKFLQHLISKKSDNAGFTLIELLVVIIIIGILSAIALPSFLNQANKARQSEAKTYVGSLNRGQQAFYLENTAFSPDVDTLGIGVKKETAYYKYTSDDIGAAAALSLAESKSLSLKPYIGVVQLVQVKTADVKDGAGNVTTAGTPDGDATTVAVLCESKKPKQGALVQADVEGIVVATPQADSDAVKCGDNVKAIQ